MLRSLQRPQKFGGVQRFEINHARTLDQGQQQIRHLRQHVKHGQHAEQCVGGSDVDPVEYGLHFAQEVGVGQHHALGVGSRAGGVEQGSDVVRCRRRRPEVAGPPSKIAGRFASQCSSMECVAGQCGPGP